MGVLIFGSGGGSGGNSDYSVVNATPEHVLLGRRFRDNKGVLREGRIPSWTGQVKSGSSQDGNKIVVSPSLSSRHIQAGSYLNHDIELAPMPEGSAAMSRDGNAITLAKGAGYIPNGESTLLLPTYSGDATIAPQKDNVVISLADKYCPHNLTILGIEVGFAELALNPSSSRLWTIDTSAYGEPQMFSFAAGGSGSGFSNYIVSGMGYRGKETGRGYVVNAGVGNIFSVDWDSTSVSLFIDTDFPNYAFDIGQSYSVWIAYL